MTKVQRENLGKFFLDVGKLFVAIFLFTSLPDKPFTFVIGLICTVVCVLIGLVFLKEG